MGSEERYRNRDCGKIRENSQRGRENSQRVPSGDQLRDAPPRRRSDSRDTKVQDGGDRKRRKKDEEVKQERSTAGRSRDRKPARSASPSKKKSSKRPGASPGARSSRDNNDSTAQENG